MSPYDLPPTRKQMHLLRRLAERTGTTFTLPVSRRDASQQITQLQRRRPSSQLERALDRHAVRGGDLPYDIG